MTQEARSPRPGATWTPRPELTLAHRPGASRAIVHGRGSLLDTIQENRWHRAEQLIAAVSMVLLGFDVTLQAGVTGALAAGVLLLPLWWPAVRERRWGTVVVVLTLVSAFWAWALPELGTGVIDAKMGRVYITTFVGFAGMFGVIVWARKIIGEPWLVACFAIGRMLSTLHDHTALFAANPWKFGFSVPITLMAIATLGWRRRVGAVALLIASAGVSMVSDARSNLAILMITMVLVAAPRRKNLTMGWMRTTALFGLLIGLVIAIYNLVQAAILDGVLGEETQQRSIAQLQTSGSLLLGGRPELGASMALIRTYPFGFGAGAVPSSTQIGVAQGGMQALNYDPNNGYVYHFMFGNGFELHSTFFDLWARCGWPGALLALMMSALIVWGIWLRTPSTSGRAALTFVGIMTLWNMPFGPMLTSMPFAVLATALALPLKSSTDLSRLQEDTDS